jgi:hypothetical protein
MKYEQSTAANISEQEKAFRTSISNDPALSYFLETGSIRPNATFAEEKIYTDPAFLTFISPYFKEVYVNAIIRAFDMKDTSLMSDIAMNTILLDNAHRKQAFDDILVYLEQRKAVLASFHSKSQKQKYLDIPNLAEHTSIIVIRNLNYLPAEFLAFRSTYARVIMKVINALVNRNLPTAVNMITDLRQLTVDVRTSHDVDALYKRLNNANQHTRAGKNGSGNSSASNDSGSSGRSARSVLSFVIGIIIAIVFAIFEMFFSDNRGYHSHRSYHYHPSYRSYHRYRR